MDERSEYEAPWKDYYAVLGAARDADSATIEAAYAALWQARTVDGECEQSNDERVALIDEAYQCLSDPASRAAYDRAYMVRRRKGARPLLKRSLSQIMLICPECHSANLHAF
ncbi:MAG: DnaJ domain-containing protein, partial [Chloroflexota bacterium]|nr:DnaJ domain-containing protein [Chloroflexota bacterium]